MTYALAARLQSASVGDELLQVVRDTIEQLSTIAVEPGAGSTVAAWEPARADAADSLALVGLEMRHEIVQSLDGVAYWTALRRLQIAASLLEAGTEACSRAATALVTQAAAAIAAVQAEDHGWRLHL